MSSQVDIEMGVRGGGMFLSVIVVYSWLNRLPFEGLNKVMERVCACVRACVGENG